MQGVVEEALRKLGWQGKSILAAGRTDTGAHASGQVIACDLDWAHTPGELQQALNNHLPDEVAVQQVRRVAPTFHPRYHARWRRYRYSIYCQPVRDPLLERYAWRAWPTANLEILQEAASLLPGKHDFAAFGTPPQAGSHTVRTVLQASWVAEAPHLVFEVGAHAFLYHMVRRLVFIQVMIGQGKLELDDLRNLLEGNRSAVALQGIKNGEQSPLIHGLAPAQGLVLVEVGYDPQAVNLVEDKEIIGYTPDAAA